MTFIQTRPIAAVCIVAITAACCPLTAYLIGRNTAPPPQHPTLESIEASTCAQVATPTAGIEAVAHERTATPVASPPPVAQPAQQETPAPESGGWQTCRASWYGAECYGNSTANGTYYDANAWGVAHRSLPFGTLIEIEYGGVTVTAPVFDRGPYVGGRTFDLSAAVASSLGFSGVQTIRYRIK